MDRIRYLLKIRVVKVNDFLLLLTDRLRFDSMVKDWMGYSKRIRFKSRFK